MRGSHGIEAIDRVELQCMVKYDLDGWTQPHLISLDDVRLIGG